MQAASAALISSWPLHPLQQCCVTRVLCLVAQSCPTLCHPMNCSPPGSSVHGLLQARILEWVAMPSSRGSSQPRDRTQVSCIADGFLTVPRICIYTCHPVTPWWSLSGVSTDHTGQYHTWSVWVYYTHSGRYNIARTSSSQFSALAAIISASFWSRTWTKHSLVFFQTSWWPHAEFLRHLHCWHPIFCQAHTGMQPSSALSSDYLEIQSIVWNLQII